MLLLAACVPVLESGKEDVPFEVPENEWGTCTEAVGLDEEGWDLGQRPPDFRMPDQNGNDTALYQFQGCLTLVDISTMWCAPCQLLAEGLQETADLYREHGFRYLTVMPQDLGSDPPDNAELNEWADFYGIAEPLLSDTSGWYAGWIPDDEFPGLYLLDAELRLIDVVNDPTDEAIRAAVEAALE